MAMHATTSPYRRVPSQNIPPAPLQPAITTHPSSYLPYQNQELTLSTQGLFQHTPTYKLSKSLQPPSNTSVSSISSHNSFHPQAERTTFLTNYRSTSSGGKPGLIQRPSLSSRAASKYILRIRIQLLGVRPFCSAKKTCLFLYLENREFHQREHE